MSVCVHREVCVCVLGVDLVAKEMEHLELALINVSPVGLRQGWGSVVHLPFLCQRELPPTPAPLAHFLPLVNL